MALDIRLDARMTQSLVMSQRMQQAIKILQLNHLEMVTAIQEAVLENPTLEAEATDGQDTEIAILENAERERKDAAEQNNGAEEGAVDWEKLIEQMNDRKGPKSLGGTIFEELPPIETNLTYGTSLSDHLVWQLQMCHLLDEERRAADAIVHNLDDRGWLVATIEELAQAAEVSVEDVESALQVVRELDPVGCGTRDLVECLVVQARVRFKEDETFERILVNHLPNLERKNYGAIARDLGLDVEDVVEYHRMIQDDLDPHPGRGFSTDEPRYITPDLYVEKHGDDWVILVNEEGVPDLKIAPYYLQILRKASKQERAYLQDKLRGAQFLIKSINKRRRTIRRVMESILRFQRDFFEQGPAALRPLVLQDVASDVGVHMSTVSRVTTNKWVHTPHGILELKYFFSAGVRQQSGVDMASEAVKTRIRTMLRAESPGRPLSDQQIAEQLKNEGVKVARRTVAKYREAMGILPSSQRKSAF